MKILQISPEAPGYESGGKLGVFQSTSALTDIAEVVDYIGPEIEHKEIEKMYSNVSYLKKTENLFELIVTAIMGQNNKRFLAWKRLPKETFDYDLYFLDFTKLNYVANDVRNINKKARIIIRVHNVEQDYAREDFRSKPNLLKFWVLHNSKRQERQCLILANKVIALTQDDAKRIKELYRIDTNKIAIIPTCVRGNGLTIFNRRKEKCIRCLITGSLWFGPNVDGVLWFIENVYPKVKNDCRLVIAGNRPNSVVEEKCKENDIELIESPREMQPLYEACDLVLAPIFNGAGMKVKIAEALSYGKPVVTTSFGAIGYDEDNASKTVIVKADNADEFAEAIKYYSMVDNDCLEDLSRKAYNLFGAKYSMEANVRYFKEQIEGIK